MAGKNKKSKMAKINMDNELYILPSKTEDMENFVMKFKVDMMEHVINRIKYAIDQKLPIIEIFQFKDSPFIITISKSEFKSNLDLIHNFLMENQIYELCEDVNKLQENLKNKTDEK